MLSISFPTHYINTFVIENDIPNSNQYFILNRMVQILLLSRRISLFPTWQMSCVIFYDSLYLVGIASLASTHFRSGACLICKMQLSSLLVFPVVGGLICWQSFAKVF